MSILTLLIVLLVLSACFGAWGGGQPGWGYRGWSPLGIVVVILVLLWATGNLSGFGHGLRLR